MMRVPVWAVSISLTMLAGCWVDDWGPDQLGRGHTSESRRQLQFGREVYGTYCVGCHGEKGDGNGPAARYLDPKPRDFRVGRIKFAYVASGDAPREEDYDRIISHGLSGTAMPSFSLLTAKERTAVVAYLRTFTKKAQTPGVGVSIGSDPFARDPEAGIEAGKAAYHAAARCWSCHPAYEPWPEIARLTVEAQLPAPEPAPDLYVSHVKDSEWGAPIRPPDFLSDRIKTGVEVGALARVIGSGVGGTAMPTWGGVLPDRQIWGLAYYVRSLALQRGMPKAEALRKTLVQPPVPVEAASDRQ
jgi:mono/diheme cytochrome c family protein